MSLTGHFWFEHPNDKNFEKKTEKRKKLKKMKLREFCGKRRDSLGKEGNWRKRKKCVFFWKKTPNMTKMKKNVLCFFLPKTMKISMEKE